MNKRSTIEACIDSLSAKDQESLNEEYQELVLSELILAVMERDSMSVKKLAKLAGVSPTVVQAMRSGIKKDFRTRNG